MRNGSGTLANDLETFNIIEQELHECRRLSLGPYFVVSRLLNIDDSLLGLLFVVSRF